MDPLGGATPFEQTADLGMWEWDVANDTAIWSEELWALLGLPKNSVACNFASWLATVHPAERAHVERTMRSTLAHGRRYEVEWQRDPERGPERWLLSRGHPIEDAQGRVSRYMGIVMDVTERHQREAALQHRQGTLEAMLIEKMYALAERAHELHTILDESPGTIAVIDSELRVRFTNATFHRWFGGSADAVSGVPLDQALGAALFDRNRAHREAVLRGEPQMFDCELPARSGEGARITRIHYVPAWVNGQVDGFYALGFDITGLKRAEAAAAAANRAKGEFLAHISHEIRTPLNAVLGLAQLGHGTTTDDHARGAFHGILDAGGHLLGLLNDVLDYAKIEAGKVALVPERIRLAPLVGHVIGVAAAAARKDALALVLDEAPHAPASFEGDRLRLQQVLINLLANAIQYTPEGSVTLRVQVEGEELLLSVVDTGIGMDDATLARVFEPFEQGATGGHAEGTGLGLSIAHSLVTAMGGSLRAQSRHAHGTCMEVRIPLVKPSPADFGPLGACALFGLPPEQALPLASALRARGVAARVCAPHDALPATLGTLVAREGSLGDALQPALERLLAAGTRVVLVSGAPAAAAIQAPALAPLKPSPGVVLLPGPPSPLRILDAVLRAPERTEAPPGPPVRRLAGVRVLAAEDNAMNQLVLREMLKLEGAACSVAADGELALALLHTNGGDAYDVLLCDIQMPGMDGYELTQRVRVRFPDLPVIGLTAHAFDMARERALAAGMVDFVSKPFLIDALVSAIARHARPSALH